MSENLRHASSYKTLFRIMPVIFKVGDINLPFPIHLDWALLFIFYLIIYTILIGIILNPILKAVGLIPWLIVVSFSVITAVFSSKYDPAGKFLPRYISDAGIFLFRNKRHTLAGPVRKFGKGKIKWTVEVD